MSGPYQPKPEDGEPPTITSQAPPNYTTFVGGYQQQPQPQPQPHLLNTLPEVFRRNRDDDDGEKQCDPELAEEVRIPVEHLNVITWAGLVHTLCMLLLGLHTFFTALCKLT